MGAKMSGRWSPYMRIFNVFSVSRSQLISFLNGHWPDLQYHYRLAGSQIYCCTVAPLKLFSIGSQNAMILTVPFVAASLRCRPELSWRARCHVWISVQHELICATSPHVFVVCTASKYDMYNFFPSHAFLRRRHKKALIRVRNRRDFENSVL